jgi:TolB-like protein
MSLLLSQAWAGQVITDDDRGWAKNAVQQEQSLAAAPAPNTVAVLSFHNRSSNAELNPLQKGFAFLLMTDLAQVEGIHVVERVRLQALVEELGLGASGIVEKGTAPRVGKLLGASHLVGGDLASGKPQELKVSSDLLQVKDQTSLGQPSADGQIEQVFDMEKKILFEIVELLKVRLTKAQKETLKRPLTSSYQALISLGMGLDASDRGNYAQAGLYYQKALEQDPGFTAAGSALKELLDLNLVTIHPRSRAILAAQEGQNSSTLSLSRNTATFREFRPSSLGEILIRW